MLLFHYTILWHFHLTNYKLNAAALDNDDHLKLLALSACLCTALADNDIYMCLN